MYIKQVLKAYYFRQSLHAYNEKQVTLHFESKKRHSLKYLWIDLYKYYTLRNILLVKIKMIYVNFAGGLHYIAN